jgi:co-chaperonin GroES (HSP10)
MLKQVYNRHILIELLEQEEKKEDKGFLLPEGYEKPKSPYALGKVLHIAEDCKTKMICIEDTIIFDRTMLQEIDIKGQKIYLILENYILGSI